MANKVSSINRFSTFFQVCETLSHIRLISTWCDFGILRFSETHDIIFFFTFATSIHQQYWGAGGPRLTGARFCWGSGDKFCYPRPCPDGGDNMTSQTRTLSAPLKKINSYNYIEFWIISVTREKYLWTTVPVFFLVLLILYRIGYWWYFSHKT